MIRKLFAFLIAAALCLAFAAVRVALMEPPALPPGLLGGPAADWARRWAWWS